MLSATRSTAFRQARRATASNKGAIRCLNVHEYISMEIMQQHGIQTPKCFVASTPEEAEDIYMKKMNQGRYGGGWMMGNIVERMALCQLSSKRYYDTAVTTMPNLQRSACRGCVRRTVGFFLLTTLTTY